MIARPQHPIPIPDAVVDFSGRQLPTRIREARKQAYAGCVSLSLCRHPRWEEGRQNALAEIASANRVLAAHDPGLVAGWGDLPGLNRKEPA